MSMPDTPRTKAWFVPIGILLTVLSVACTPQAPEASRPITWVATWGAAPSTPGRFGGGPEPQEMDFADRTLRQVVHVSVGGDSVRIRLSNRDGSVPLEVGAVHVAARTEESGIDPATDRALTFGGRPGITIPMGAVALSDPVGIQVEPLSDLAISVYFPSATGSPTSHGTASQTNYYSAGNHVADASISEAETTRSWFFLTRVDVWPTEPTGVVVTLGNSITDGTLSTPDTNNRWPDHLAQRLAARDSGTLAVVNSGISGNRVLNDLPGFGIDALSRLEDDVLSVAGVTHVVVLEGINDIGMAGTLAPESEIVSADDIIAGHLQIIARAHARGLRVYGATLTPFEDAFYYSPEREEKRQAVNEWIRSSGAYDAVIDFDAVTRDPANPEHFLPGFSEDNLHPNDGGYGTMAEAVDLSLFDLE
ncbi:MAG: SGNH/GDSL hydrolase family protein [Gemmatimonadota bacterium]|jgi:lysophospholipase L1-like esterase